MTFFLKHIFQLSKLLLLILLALTVSAVRGQGVIQGQVRDSISGSSIHNAHLTLDHTDSHAISGKDGRYSLQVPGSGTFRLRVSHIGYQAFERDVQVPERGTVKVDVGMEQKAYEAREVVISGEASDEARIRAIPFRTTLLTSGKMQSDASISLAGTLDFISGVNMNSTLGIFSGNTVVSMRGLSGDDQSRVLVLIDGIPMNKADQGSVNWNLLNGEDVADVEIIKGPGAAVYGTNAMGGTIHIHTREPNEILEGRISCDYGTYNTFGSRWNMMGRIPGKSDQHYTWSAAGFMRRSDGYQTAVPEYLEPGDTFTTQTYLKELNLNTRFGYHSDKFNLEAGLNCYDDQRGRGIQVFEQDGAHDQHDSYQVFVRSHGNAGKARWSIHAYLLNEYFFRLNEYMNEGEYNLYEVNSTRQDGGVLAQVAYGTRPGFMYEAGVEIKLGAVDATDTYYTSTDVISNRGEIDLYSAFIQKKTSLIKDKLHLYAGIRADHARFHDGAFTVEYPSYSIQYMTGFQDSSIIHKNWTAVTPRVSLQYNLGNGNRILFSAARGFRSPGLDDLCRSGRRSNGFKISNPQLEPEYIYSYELTSDWSLLRRVTLSPSVYFSRGQNFMYDVGTGDTVNMAYMKSPIIQKQNISKVDILGAEIDLKVALPFDLDVFCSYSYSYSSIRRANEIIRSGDSTLQGKHLTQVPDHKATLGLTWKNRFVHTSLMAKYVGERWINEYNLTDPYLLTDRYKSYMTLNWKVWRTFSDTFVLALSVENIFNEIFINDRLQRSPGRMIRLEVGIKF